MTNQKTFLAWMSSMMLVYALMLPVASGASSDLDTKRNSDAAQNNGQQEIQSKAQSEAQSEAQLDISEHKHSHHSHSHKKMSSEEVKQMRMKKVQRLAHYFDISVEGKSVEQLRAEIDKAKKEQPEKWEAFKQEFRTKKLEKMREYAESKGIDAKGKTLEQLHDELYELKQRSE